MSAIQAAATKHAAKRGSKRTCEEADCGRRFYDLNKAPAACPYCGIAFIVRAVAPSVPSRSFYKPKIYEIRQDPVLLEEAALLPENTTPADDEPAADAEDIPEIDDEDLAEDVGIARDGEV